MTLKEFFSGFWMDENILKVFSLKKNTLLLGLVPHLVHDLRRHSRNSRCIWLTCWGYHSVCCLCIFSKRWKQPIGFSRMANSDPSQQLWRSGVCHPLCPCVSTCTCPCWCLWVWETREWWTKTYNSWTSLGLMATIGELFYNGCGWIIRTSIRHRASIQLPSGITFTCIRSFKVWCHL